MLVLTGLALFNSIFFSNLLQKNNLPTISNSILKIYPKFQDLTFDFPDDDEMAHLGLKDLFRISSSHTSLFWGLRSALWALGTNCWRQNNQTPIYVLCDDRLASRILVFLLWLRYSTLAIQKRKSSKQKPGSSLLFIHNFRTQKQSSTPLNVFIWGHFPSDSLQGSSLRISTFCVFLGWYWIRAPDSSFQKWWN